MLYARFEPYCIVMNIPCFPSPPLLETEYKERKYRYPCPGMAEDKHLGATDEHMTNNLRTSSKRIVWLLFSSCMFRYCMKHWVL